MSPDEALVEPERRQMLDIQRLCAGRRPLEKLERGYISPADHVRRLERRVAGLPRIFELQRDTERRVKELIEKLHRGEITRARFEFLRHRFQSAMRGIIEREFVPGYALTSEQEELADARCALARARWEYLIWLRTGRVPGRVVRSP